MGNMISRPYSESDEEADDELTQQLVNFTRTYLEQKNRPENGEARPPHHLTQRRQKPGTRNFFKNIGAVATLGAGLAFSLILSTLQDPKEASIWKLLDLRTVRILLAVSWFLFMLTLALSFTIGSNKHTKASVWKTLYLLDIAAVACLSIVVAAYVEVVGFTGAVFAIVFGIVVILD